MTDPFDPSYVEEKLPAGYYPALGRLTHAFAVLEVDLAATIKLIVAHRAGVGGPDGYSLIVAIIGGMRFDPLRDSLKRLLRVANADKATRDYVDQLFSHLSEVQWLRNRLHHNLTSAWSGEGCSLINSDIDSVREADRAHAFGFTPEMVHAAATDIHIFIEAMTLVAEALQEGKTFNPPELPAWRYKPSLLVR